MPVQRVAPGKQEMDIFCPVRVSGWIKNIQRGVIAGKNNDRERNRNLSIFKDCSYIEQHCTMEKIPAR